METILKFTLGRSKCMIKLKIPLIVAGSIACGKNILIRIQSNAVRVDNNPIGWRRAKKKALSICSSFCDCLVAHANVITCENLQLCCQTNFVVILNILRNLGKYKIDKSK
jgi:hypothetical protein